MLRFILLTCLLVANSYAASYENAVWILKLGSQPSPNDATDPDPTYNVERYDNYGKPKHVDPILPKPEEKEKDDTEKIPDDTKRHVRVVGSGPCDKLGKYVPVEDNYCAFYFCDQANDMLSSDPTTVVLAPKMMNCAPHTRVKTGIPKEGVFTNPCTEYADECIPPMKDNDDSKDEESQDDDKVTSLSSKFPPGADKNNPVFVMMLPKHAQLDPSQIKDQVNRMLTTFRAKGLNQENLFRPLPEDAKPQEKQYEENYPAKPYSQDKTEVSEEPKQPHALTIMMMRKPGSQYGATNVQPKQEEEDNKQQITYTIFDSKSGKMYDRISDVESPPPPSSPGSAPRPHPYLPKDIIRALGGKEKSNYEVKQLKDLEGVDLPFDRDQLSEMAHVMRSLAHTITDTGTYPGNNNQ